MKLRHNVSINISKTRTFFRLARCARELSVCIHFHSLWRCSREWWEKWSWYQKPDPHLLSERMGISRSEKRNDFRVTIHFRVNFEMRVKELEHTLTPQGASQELHGSVRVRESFEKKMNAKTCTPKLPLPLQVLFYYILSLNRFRVFAFASKFVNPSLASSASTSTLARSLVDVVVIKSSRKTGADVRGSDESTRARLLIA